MSQNPPSSHISDHRTRAVRAASGSGYEAVLDMSAHPEAHAMTVMAEPQTFSARQGMTERIRYRDDPAPLYNSVPGDDEPDKFCTDVVAKFLEQASEQVDHEPFMPFQEYLVVTPELTNAPLAGFFWHNAGPSKKTNRVCWSWRYLSGCALIMNHHYPKDAIIRFSKQDRSEWAKVARFVNTVVTRIAPRVSQLSYLILDVLAMNSGLCRSLRKLPRQKAFDAALRIANAINAVDISPSNRVTNSMGILRIFEVLTRHTAEQLSTMIGLPIPHVSIDYSLAAPATHATPLLPTISVRGQPAGLPIDAIPAPIMDHQPLPDTDHLLVPHYWDHTHDSTFYTPGFQHPHSHWEPAHPQDYEPFMNNHWDTQEYTPSNTSECENSSISGTSSDYVDGKRKASTEGVASGVAWTPSWPSHSA